MLRSKNFELFYFFLLLFSFTSCVGKNKSTLSKENKTSSQEITVPTFQDVIPDPIPQVAEYIVEIYEDKKGTLWFGTMSKGAARYDGKTLTYLSKKDGLVGNTILSFAEDHDGNLWLGSHSGATKYDGKNFTNYSEDKGLHGAGCKFLVDRKGNIWAGTNHGVFRFDGSTFSEFQIPKPNLKNLSYKWEAGKIWQFMEDSKGNFWFARDGYGVCKFDGTSFTHFTTEDGLCSNNVSGLAEDNDGNMWFGSLSSDSPKYMNHGGLSRYDGKKFTQFPEIKGLSENDIYTIYKDKKGNIWIGAIGHGGYQYDGEKFTLFDKVDNMDLLKNFAIQSVLEDKKGNLWFGFSGGLFRLSGMSFVNVTQNGPW